MVPAETVLTGVVPDQAALLGLLGWLQSLGLEVVEVRRVPGCGAILMTWSACYTPWGGPASRWTGSPGRDAELDLRDCGGQAADHLPREEPGAPHVGRQALTDPAVHVGAPSRRAHR